MNERAADVAGGRPLRVVLFSLHWVEYLIELANALSARGHRVGIIVAKRRVKATVGDELNAVLDPRVKVLVVEDHAVGLRDPRQWWSAARILGFVRRMRPDILHIQDSTNAIVALCLPAWRHLPVVLTVHDVTTHPGRDSEGPSRRATVRDTLRARADAIIVHGDTLRKRYVEQHTVGTKRVESIPHGCYGIFRHWAKEAVQNEPQTILFFGRIEMYKGLANLLDAFRSVLSRCPAARLLIAGDGEDLRQHRDTLESLPGCELHAGYVPTEHVAAFFQRATVAVLPYVEGSQSGVTRIAYAFGCPVVVTDVGSIPESVVDGITGLVVPPRDTAALASALIAVISDPRLRAHLARGASAMAEEIMSWARVAERQEALFVSLLAVRKRKPG